MKILCVVLLLVSAVCAWEIQKGEIVKTESNTFLFIEDYNGTITKNLLVNLEPKGIKKLELYNNTISDIEDGALCASPVESITLFRNFQLPNLTRAMFGDCPSLTHLDLSGPDDVHLDSDVLHGKDNVETLYLLYYKTIEEITLDNWSNMEKMKDLSIQFTNLRKIDAKIFEHMKDLEKMYIMNNQVEVVEGIFTNTKLEYFDLTNNKLTAFEWDSVKNLGNLVWFNVKDNEIKNFDLAKIAEYMPKLNIFLCGSKDEECEVDSKLNLKLRRQPSNATDSNSTSPEIIKCF